MICYIMQGIPLKTIIRINIAQDWKYEEGQDEFKGQTD